MRHTSLLKPVHPLLESGTFLLFSLPNVGQQFFLDGHHHLVSIMRELTLHFCSPVFIVEDSFPDGSFLKGKAILKQNVYSSHFLPATILASNVHVKRFIVLLDVRIRVRNSRKVPLDFQARDGLKLIVLRF
jgi:hypothetical protein